VLYAPLDVILRDTSIVQPDVVYLDPTRLGAEGYSLALRAARSEPASPPPFPDLSLVPASLWP
jgi:hypothetical protein